MRTILVEKTLYKYEELSDTAKQRVSEYFSQDAPDTDCIFEDAVRLGAMMGIEIDHRCWTNPSGFKGKTPKIYYSGFSSQGDGACFEGTYRYAKGAVAAIKKETGFGFVDKEGVKHKGDEELIAIAQGLQDVQRKHFYRLYASCKQRGHYQHSGCMAVDVEDCENPYRDIGESEQDVRDLLRLFADWIYSRLEDDYDYQTSDEAIAENCDANEYEFTGDGVMRI